QTSSETGPHSRPPVSWYTMSSCKEVKDGHGGRVRARPKGAFRGRARHQGAGPVVSPFAAQDPGDAGDAGTQALPPAQAAAVASRSLQVDHRCDPRGRRAGAAQATAYGPQAVAAAAARARLWRQL